MLRALGFWSFAGNSLRLVHLTRAKKSPDDGAFRAQRLFLRAIGGNSRGSHTMVVEQKALVEEALLARTRSRARRAYVQALKGGANRAVAFEAAVDSLLEADHTISEAEARVIAGHEIDELEASGNTVPMRH